MQRIDRVSKDIAYKFLISTDILMDESTGIVETRLPTRKEESESITVDNWGISLVKLSMHSGIK